MKKYIYKITNNINGKTYIGQTVNYRSRFCQHKAKMYGHDENKYLYRAFDKYGIENFSFEILEGPISNYNEREIYWISYYHSYINDLLFCNGYNLTPGGENPPVYYGEDCHFSSHSKQEADKVKKLLIETKLSTKEIGNICNYDDTAVVRINKGEIWYDELLDYPLRKEINFDYLNQRADEIIDDLKNSCLTQAEIAKKYHIGRTTVTAINNGQNHFRENESYPIRTMSQRVDAINGKIEMIKDGEVIKTFSSSDDVFEYLKSNKLTTASRKSKVFEGIRKCAKGLQKTCYGFSWRIENM